MFQMNGNKIFRRYIIDKIFFLKTNKKVTLEKIILRIVKKNQRKYGHTKTLPYNTIKLFVKNFEIRWKKYKHKNYFYIHSSTWLNGDEKLIDKHRKYNYII